MDIGIGAGYSRMEVIGSTGGVYNMGMNIGNGEMIFDGGSNQIGGDVGLGNGITSRGTLVVSNNAYLGIQNLTVGQNGGVSNLVLIDQAASKLVITNDSGTSVYDIQGGTNLQNNGTVIADKLIITNSQGVYQLNGGTTVVGQVTVSNGQAFVVGDGSGTEAYFRQTQAGVTNTFANGLVVNNDGHVSFAGVVTNLITFNGGVISGNATFTELIVANGATLSPGNSPGLQNFGTLEWGTGGNYLWEVNNFGGTQGIDPGWDFINVTGLLDITANPGNKFNINVKSLTLANAAGNAIGFNQFQDYQKSIIQALTISGFNTNNLNLDMTGFANDYSLGGGVWFLSADSQNIYLNYQILPVPEPSTYVMLVAGMICAGLALRYRRKVQPGKPQV